MPPTTTSPPQMKETLNLLLTRAWQGFERHGIESCVLTKGHRLVCKQGNPAVGEKRFRILWLSSFTSCYDTHWQAGAHDFGILCISVWCLMCTRLRTHLEAVMSENASRLFCPPEREATGLKDSSPVMPYDPRWPRYTSALWPAHTHIHTYIHT